MSDMPDTLPTMSCPRCDYTVTDFDGFPFSFCPMCRWCAHDSISGDVCDACGQTIVEEGTADETSDAGQGLQLTIHDPVDGTTDTITIPMHDYFIIATGDCRVDVQAYPTTGTHVLTVKGRRR